MFEVCNRQSCCRTTIPKSQGLTTSSVLLILHTMAWVSGLALAPGVSFLHQAAEEALHDTAWCTLAEAWTVVNAAFKAAAASAWRMSNSTRPRTHGAEGRDTGQDTCPPQAGMSCDGIGGAWRGPTGLAALEAPEALRHGGGGAI